MLCNLLHIQALLLTISVYLFTAPEHLVGQNSKEESSQSTVEQPKLGAAGVEMQRTLVLWKCNGAQWLSGWASREQSCCCFGPWDGRKQPPFSKERACTWAGGELQSCLIQAGATTPQDNLAGRLGICQSKMLFRLTAWGGLFLPLASLGGDKGPSCGLCTALEWGLSNLGKARSFFFFFILCLSSS